MLRKSKSGPPEAMKENGSDLPSAPPKAWENLDGLAISQDGRIAGIDRDFRLVELPRDSWAAITWVRTEGGSMSRYARIPSDDELRLRREDSQRRERRLTIENLRGEIPSELAIVDALERGDLDTIQSIFPAMDSFGRKLAYPADSVQGEIERRKRRVAELKTKITRMEAVE